MDNVLVNDSKAPSEVGDSNLILEEEVEKIKSCILFPIMEEHVNKYRVEYRSKNLKLQIIVTLDPISNNEIASIGSFYLILSQLDSKVAKIFLKLISDYFGKHLYIVDVTYNYIKALEELKLSYTPIIKFTSTNGTTLAHTIIHI